MSNTKTEKRIRRHKKIRAKVGGTSLRPRLAIFKSNTRIYAQIIDDVSGKTIVSVSDNTAKGKTKTERARSSGFLLAKNAVEKKIEKVVFDRGGFIYTGRVKAFAEGARDGGLKF